MNSRANFADWLGFRRGRWAKPHDSNRQTWTILARKSFERFLAPQQVFFLASYCQLRNHMIPKWPSVQYRMKRRQIIPFYTCNIIWMSSKQWGTNVYFLCRWGIRHVETCTQWDTLSTTLNTEHTYKSISVILSTYSLYLQSRRIHLSLLIIWVLIGLLDPGREKGRAVVIGALAQMLMITHKELIIPVLCDEWLQWACLLPVSHYAINRSCWWGPILRVTL